MQENGVIQASKSPWLSPVVLVQKKDGFLRFCIELNSLTKPDTFPLPRIDNLLDQLGKAKYVSTLDLVSGFWQICMHPQFQEKTAFSTLQGLYEFQVMPFGLMNAPSVFQRLIQQVLMGLNPESGPSFVAAYIDDILVFSNTLEDHLKHLHLVPEHLRQFSLKLKPAKCRFARKEVEYLGHILTPEGLKSNPALVSAVREFPVPTNLKELRRFLGLASYYHWFISKLASIAQPLHHLTCKDVPFVWTEAAASAFEELKQRLTTSPVLAYPSFDQDFVLETNAQSMVLAQCWHKSNQTASYILLPTPADHSHRPRRTIV